jgi:endonuclease YncB( thermonuclease family)
LRKFNVRAAQAIGLTLPPSLMMLADEMDRIVLLGRMSHGVQVPAHAAELAGQATVIDGDPLEIHGERIRLAGINAPEHDQLCSDAQDKAYQCGALSANRLSEWVDRKPVICIPRDRDRYGRTVAACTVDGKDIGEWLVRNGLAIRWPLYDREGCYSQPQMLAQEAKVGI